MPVDFLRGKAVLVTGAGRDVRLAPMARGTHLELMEQWAGSFRGSDGEPAQAI